MHGVEAHGDAYLTGAAARVVDAWARFDAAARAQLDAAVRDASRRATARVVGELRDLLARDPAGQRATPLEVVRSLRREVTIVLRDAGIPPVERDVYEERALPDDDYGLAPRTLGELGDPDLAPLHLAWGVGKATVIRARMAADDA